MLNIAATLGIPAALAFCDIVAMLWVQDRRPVDHTVWAGLAGLALDSLAADIEDWRFVWILFGLAGTTNEQVASSPVGSSQFAPEAHEARLEE